MKYLLGIDIGTSGTKAALFDTDGVPVRSVTVEYPLSQPKNGWAEQNPEDWWNAVKQAVDCIGTDNVVGIGLSGQMHGLVMLDENSEVIRPSIIWCDQRTSAECEEITEKIGSERLIQITANRALTGFTASKIMWVKKNEPQIYERCRHILLPKDYIRYKLTGEFATDVSDASGTQLFDVKKRCWSDEMLRELNIDRNLLPKVYESAEISGYYNGIPVAAGGGDNACAAVGCGAVSTGKGFVTVGTSGVVYAHTDEAVIDKLGRIHSFCSAVPGRWHVMGVTQAAGLSLKWFRENFAENLSYGELDNMAEDAGVGADGLLYLPYLMGERTPHFDPNARGVFIGISAAHTRGHFARAVMEGVAYSLRDCLEILRESGIEIMQMAAAGGGTKSELWRGIMSDVFNVPLNVMKENNGSEAAFGAAVIGGVAAGVYSSVEDACERLCKTGMTQEQNLNNVYKYNRIYKAYRAVYPNIKENFKELAEILHIG